MWTLRTWWVDHKRPVRLWNNVRVAKLALPQTQLAFHSSLLAAIGKTLLSRTACAPSRISPVLWEGIVSRDSMPTTAAQARARARRGAISFSCGEAITLLRAETGHEAIHIARCASVTRPSVRNYLGQFFGECRTGPRSIGREKADRTRSSASLSLMSLLDDRSGQTAIQRAPSDFPPATDHEPIHHREDIRIGEHRFMGAS